MTNGSRPGPDEAASAAMKRFVCDDSQNPHYTLFRYSPAHGLGPQPGVGRRARDLGDQHSTRSVELEGLGEVLGYLL